MLRRHVAFTIVAATVASLALAPAAQAQSRTLRVANWLPPVHHMSATLAAWGAELEKASGGELKVEVMKNALAKPDGQYDLAKNGIVDIAWSVAAYHPKQFQKLMAIEVPFLAPTAEVAAVAAWRWYAKNGFIATDTGDTHLLTFFAHSPHAYHSRKDIKTLSDLEGLKIRAGGNGVAIAKAVGGVPVFISPGEANEALTRGTVDVTQFPWESVKGLRLAEAAKYHLEFPGGLYAGIFYMTMSPKTWASLTPSQKAAVDKVSGEAGARFISRLWEAADQAGRDEAKARGNTIRQLSPADTDALKTKIASIDDDWVKAADGAGLNGKALLADLRAIVADLAKR